MPTQNILRFILPVTLAVTALASATHLKLAAAENGPADEARPGEEVEQESPVAAPDEPHDPGAQLFLRITVREPDVADHDALYVRSCYIGGRRARATVQERQRVMPFADKPGGRTPWFALPVKKGKVPYSGVTLYVGPVLHHRRLTDYELNLDRIVLEVELAVAPAADEIQRVHRLRPILTHGNGVPFFYESGDLAGVPERARWLVDHLGSLHRGLADAGYATPVDIHPRTMRLGILLSNHRFGAGPYGMLSRDPDVYWLYGDIFALAGYNVGTRGVMRQLYDNHTHFRHNMVPAAASSRELPADFLPPGLNIPEDMDESYRKRADDIRAGDGLVPLWNKLGDEIGVSGWVDTPRARDVLLREAKIVTGDAPSELGLANWAELEPVTKTNPGEVAGNDRLRYYITLRARNILSAEGYAVQTAAKWKHFGEKTLTQVNMLGPMYYGGYSARFWWRQTPDYFRMADLHAVDVLQVQGLNSAYPPGGPLILSLLSPKVAAQAAARHARVEPELMHFACRTPPEPWAHVVFSSLISGVPNIDWYRFGPRATGWEWSDSLPKMLGHARLARTLDALEPYLPDTLSPPNAEVALLWAESTDLWQRHARCYSKSELRSTFFALRFSGVETDLLREYMIEGGELNRYSVLFAAQRNVNRRVQKTILEWVKQGGTLVLTPGALTHDAADRPATVLAGALSPGIAWEYDDSLPEASGEFSNVPELARVTWTSDQPTSDNLAVYFHRQIIDGEAEVIAEFAGPETREVAARQMALGNGTVLALGFFPGHSYTTGSARAVREKTVEVDPDEYGEDDLVRGVVRTGSPYWMEPNETARRMIARIVETAGISPHVTVDKPTVDSGVYLNGNHAVILLANYRPFPRDRVTVETSLPERFRGAQARDLSGNPVELAWPDNATVRFSVKLNSAQAVLIDTTTD